LVRRALVDVCTVPVLLVHYFIFFNYFSAFEIFISFISSESYFVLMFKRRQLFVLVAYRKWWFQGLHRGLSWTTKCACHQLHIVQKDTYGYLTKARSIFGSIPLRRVVKLTR